MSRTRYVDPSEFVKPKFTYPEVPKDVPVGTCSKCGGSTRAEEFQSWTKLEGLTKKRVFRCIQHGHRCPAVTITVGQEDESMAKPKVIAQTPEWCARMKAACVKKHIRYQDLGAACGLSESTLAQSLNMHSTLSEAAQKAVEQAIEDYTDEPPQSVKARNMAKVRAAKAKPKSETQKAFEPLPASLQVSESMGKMADAMAKETEETILRNLQAQEALPPGATVTWGEEQPKPGLVQPSEELVIVDVTGPTTFLEASDAPEPIQGWSGPFVDAIRDLEQRHKAVECKIDGVAELYYGLEQRHQVLEADVMALQARYHQHEDRLTSTYDHLTEQIGNMAGLVGQPANEVPLLWRTVSPKPVDGFDYWLEEQRRNRPPSLDEVVDALSKYSDSQLAALVTAATARRDLLKAMEAA